MKVQKTVILEFHDRKEEKEKAKNKIKKFVDLGYSLEQENFTAEGLKAKRVVLKLKEYL